MADDVPEHEDTTDTRVVSIRVPTALFHLLSQHARQHGVSLNRAVRAAIQARMAHRPHMAQVTLAEAAVNTASPRVFVTTSPHSYSENGAQAVVWLNLQESEGE